MTKLNVLLWMIGSCLLSACTGNSFSSLSSGAAANSADSVSSSSTATTTSTSTSTDSRWMPAPGTSWQIQYTGTMDYTLSVGAFDLDLFDAASTTVTAKLHAQGTKVICYFSGGSYENWRPDISSFPASVLGNGLDGWPGEQWLDVRQLTILEPIMAARMDLAVQKGCDAVDVDNMDGYTNSTGFALTAADQLAYNQMMATEAHKRGLSIGLKNDLDQISTLVTSFDFAVNESCYDYNECDQLLPFIKANKAVFGIEYDLATTNFCPKANAANFDFLKKDLELSATRTSCR